MDTETVTALVGLDEESLRDFHGAETFLVGIAPTFWAHVPLSINQVQNLGLTVDGVHCLLQYSDDDNGAPKLIPISKCKITGCIVSSERKANGCILYVIDDGTGLMDVLYWDDDDDLDGALNGLPSLTGEQGYRHIITNSNNKQPQDTVFLRPGEMVKVLGRIQCVGEETVDVTDTKTLQVQTATSGRNNTSTTTTTCRFVAGSVIREIHAMLLQPIAAGGSRATPSSMDCESQHWLECMRVQQQEQQQSSTEIMLGNMTNAIDVLKVLGKDIAAQVADQGNLPAADDTVGAWRLYGTKCRCESDRIKNELLYCHCIATTEPLDPSFRYRDALLMKLLRMEEKEASQHAETETKHHPLQFQYQEISMDEQLIQVASTAAPESEESTFAAQQLARNTFRALCKDGVLHLLNTESDTYLLVSCKHVLKPYVQHSLQCKDAAARQRFYAKKPAYIDKVPSARLQMIRRGIVLQQQQQETSSNSDR